MHLISKTVISPDAQTVVDSRPMADRFSSAGYRTRSDDVMHSSTHVQAQAKAPTHTHEIHHHPRKELVAPSCLCHTTYSRQDGSLLTSLCSRQRRNKLRSVQPFKRSLPTFKIPPAPSLLRKGAQREWWVGIRVPQVWVTIGCENETAHRWTCSFWLALSDGSRNTS